MALEWSEVLAILPEDVESNKAVCEGLHDFFVHSQLPATVDEAPPQLQESDNLFRLLHVLRNVAKEKGLDAQAAEDELRELHSKHEATRAHMDTSEKDLVEKVVELEKDLRLKDDVIEGLRHQLGTTSPSVTARQVRHLREEVEDLTQELDELKRSLGQERVENQRLMQSASSERLKSRQLEREVDKMRHNLEDYRKQLDWQREQGGGVGKGTVEADCRERLRRKDLEMAEQLDKIEELLNARDNLEEQLHEVTVQLGHVEEQRLVTLKENAAMKSALVESDSRCDELDTKNRVLEGRLADLQEKLTQQALADDHIINLVHARAQEWEGILATKDEELISCRDKIRELDGQSKAVEQTSNRATFTKMKKELQSRESELEAMRKELAEATTQVTNMNSQLEQLTKKGDTGLINSALKQELELVQEKVKTLESDLVSEVNRREQEEVEKEERDVQLTQALGRLGEYERGEYGLHEAVLEIKVKKEELAVRDKDISELTQEVNHLEGELNKFGEENEALRGRLNLGREDSVDVSGVRARRVFELDKLRKENRMLENEVEQLKEDRLSLRKQMLDQAITKRSSPYQEDVDANKPSHPSLVELELKLREADKVCQQERQVRVTWQNKAETLKGRLKQTQEQLNQLKVVVKELKGHDPNIKTEALERLIALLEIEGSGNDIALVLQLKSQLSEQIGQNEVLNELIQRVRDESRQALKELERKECQMEVINKELLALKKMQSGFQSLPLPAEATSSVIMSSHNEQLLHTLQQLHSHEEALQEAKKSLEMLQRKFSVVIHQQGVLYQEYMDSDAKWQAEREQTAKQKEKLFAQLEESKVKVEELEHLQASLNGNEDHIHQRLGEMSRKVTRLLISEKVLVRKQKLLQEVVDGLRKDNLQLHQDKLKVEKAVREKVAYLQRHKETAMFKLNSLHEQLFHSVSTEEFDKANHQYNQLAIKYQQLLQQHTSYTSTAPSVEILQTEIHTLTHQLEGVKQELVSEKEKNRLIPQSAPHSSDEASSGTVMKNQIATMEMQVLNERQRAELTTVRCQQLQDVLTQLEQRNSSLEDKVSEVTQCLLIAQETEGDLRNQLTSSLPQASKAILEKTITQLKKSEAKLLIDNSHLKEVAEVARQQAIAMEMVQKSDDLEVRSLRHQLLDLQSGSDDRTTVGRLHHQLLALQVSEAKALKRQEVAESKILKLEASLLHNEQQRSLESEAMFQYRVEYSNHVKQLRKTIQCLRRQYSGAVPLSEYERHSHLIQQAREDSQEACRLKKEAQKYKSDTQDRLAELEVQRFNLEELIATLQDSNPGSTTAHLTEWHSKLGEMRLVELKLTRCNEQLQEEVKHLENVVSASEKAFSKLEQELVTVTKNYELNQLSWEQREAELEKKLEVQSNASKRPDNYTTQMQLFSGLEQDNIPPSKSFSEEKVALTQQLEGKNEEIRHLEQALSNMRTELLGKDSELVKLSEVLNKIESREASAVAMADHVEKDDHQCTLVSSLESTKYLKAELSVKEKMVEKYQQMLQDTRREHESEILSYKHEIAALREKINTQAHETFSQLKKTALEAANVPPPVLPTDKQMERLLELEDVSMQQKQEIKRLQQEVETRTQQRALCEQSYEARISKIKQESKELTQQYRHEMDELRGSLSEKTSRATELEQEVEVLEGELSAAQQAAKQAPSRTMKSLVEKLRNQLSLKEKQQRALSEALLRLRADLVETAQKTLENEVGNQESESNIQHLISQGTAELRQQVVYLTTTLDEVRRQLSQYESHEMKISEELEKTRHLLQVRETQLRNIECELQKKQKALEQAKNKEDKLVHKLHQLELEIENSPKVLELQKRVKLLQGKLDKQKDQSMEEKMKASTKGHGVPFVRGDVSKLPEGISGAERASVIDSRHQAMEVMRWEEGKKWQKKFDVIRERLTEKTGEIETLQKQVICLRELQNRTDREKSFLSSRVKSLQKQLDGGNVTTHPESKGSGDHRVDELETVITAMKKVIEKLKVENDHLKKSSAASSKLAQAKIDFEKRLAALQDENSKLKMEITKLQQASVMSTAIPKLTYDKIVSENDRLVRDHKKEVQKTEKLQLALATLQLQHDKLAHDVECFNKSASISKMSSLLSDASPHASHGVERGEFEIRVEQLQAEVEKKTTMLIEVKRHLKEAAERERELKELSSDVQLSEKYLNLIKERDALKQETAQMRKELDAFDSSFFEEIEDLKYNYHECLRRNVELEERLSHLTRPDATQ